jgi:tRNA-guanine family transglycosylase
VILGNTYHLELRPGSPLMAELGGLHQVRLCRYKSIAELMCQLNR